MPRGRHYFPSAENDGRWVSRVALNVACVRCCFFFSLVSSLSVTSRTAKSTLTDRTSEISPNAISTLNQGLLRRFRSPAVCTHFFVYIDGVPYYALWSDCLSVPCPSVLPLQNRMRQLEPRQRRRRRVAGAGQWLTGDRAAQWAWRRRSHGRVMWMLRKQTLTHESVKLTHGSAERGLGMRTVKHEWGV